MCWDHVVCCSSQFIVDSHQPPQLPAASTSSWVLDSVGRGCRGHRAPRAFAGCRSGGGGWRIGMEVALALVLARRHVLSLRTMDNHVSLRRRGRSCWLRPMASASSQLDSWIAGSRSGRASGNGNRCRRDRPRRTRRRRAIRHRFDVCRLALCCNLALATDVRAPAQARAPASRHGDHCGSCALWHGSVRAAWPPGRLRTIHAARRPAWYPGYPDIRCGTSSDVCRRACVPIAAYHAQQRASSIPASTIDHRIHRVDRRHCWFRRPIG
ncbi:hypothetical protein CC85DRAFT_125888 [Cutaneotrichosporon oleaginosum]|uniref:Uncharacterized protein n=1 Tax=Cutaneotrichosporon oleaginosum TaxID=879819 RepID=A0A0J0XJE3_9TREE|nr:uncharacterized protein CC85DRAFT_125888 [Cutaneotrichosporon oleaginosum]KLT41225.1 hypothetical protein CC85DRAFT_125888 [Cutaneotrichosporon oleaginosum]TXT05490.1 hypothetical protein COLE_06810 [Cutaneotrichosporon oleaginosum]